MSLGKVVVVVTLDFPNTQDLAETAKRAGTDRIIDPDPTTTIARFRELGLHAHGPDRASAVRNLKFHFRHYIEALRETGDLRERLEALGADWEPIDQARARGLDFEDLSPDKAEGHLAARSEDSFDLVLESMELRPAA